MSVPVTLESCDGKVFEVDDKVSSQFRAIKKHLPNDPTVEGLLFRLPVKGEIIEMMLEYCTKHVEEEDPTKLKAWDANFVKVDVPILDDLLRAAHHLKIRSLIDIIAMAYVRKFGWRVVKGANAVKPEEESIVTELMGKVEIVLKKSPVDVCGPSQSSLVC